MSARMDPLEPRAELARLAGGLAAALGRRRRSGRRRLPAAAPDAALPPSPLAASPPEAGAAGDATAPGPGAARIAPTAPPRRSNPDRGEARPPGGVTAARVAGSPLASAESAPGPGTARAARVERLAKALEERHRPTFLERVERVAEQARSAPDLEALRERVAVCEACRLCRGRTRTVFADGDARARVMFVGEGPGAEEDRQGVPFVGPAGRLLTDIVEKGMGLERSRDVYIANVVKCRPPQNRDPGGHEKAICTGWLERQIELVDPEVIVPLGRHAAGFLLDRDDSMARLRGRVWDRGGRAVVPTYHPAWVLRQSGEGERAAKAKVWADVRRAMAVLGLGPDGAGSSGGSAR